MSSTPAQRRLFYMEVIARASAQLLELEKSSTSQAALNRELELQLNAAMAGLRSQQVIESLDATPTAQSGYSPSRQGLPASPTA